MSKRTCTAIVIFVSCLGCTDTPRAILLQPDTKTIEVPVTPMAFAPFDMHTGTYTGTDGSFSYFLSASDSAVHLVPADPALPSQAISLAAWLKTKKRFHSLASTGIWMESALSVWIDFPRQDTLYKLDIPSGKVDDYRVIAMPGTYHGNPVERLRLLPIHGINRSGETVYFSVNCYYGDVSRSHETPPGAPVLAAFKTSGKTLQFVAFAGTLPESYYRKNMYLNESYGITTGADSILVNHFYSDSVTLVTDHGKTAEPFILKSKKSTAFKGLSGNPKDQNAIMKLFISDQRYLRLLYDPYRKLVYRIYVHQGKATGNGKIAKPGKWSFLVFDQSLTPCGETELDVVNYNPGTILITPEGVFIRKNKPEGNVRDSTVVLQLFKPVADSIP